MEGTSTYAVYPRHKGDKSYRASCHDRTHKPDMLTIDGGKGCLTFSTSSRVGGHPPKTPYPAWPKFQVLCTNWATEEGKRHMRAIQCGDQGSQSKSARSLEGAFPQPRDIKYPTRRLSLWYQVYVC